MNLLKQDLAAKLIGIIILISIVITCLVFILQDFRIYLIQFQNGLLLNAIAFSVILMVSIFGLFLTMKTNSKDISSGQQANQVPPPFSIGFNLLGNQLSGQVVNHFLDGFLNGLRSPKKSKNII